MNPRMPYYSSHSSASSTSSDYHNGYGSTHHWNDMRTDHSMSSSQNYRSNWKRNKNWQPKFNREQVSPYNVPKKSYQSYTPRFQRNRYDNGNAYYNTNANSHQNSWGQPHKTKAIKSPEGKESEQSIPGVIANKKKRKPMSKSYPSNKWDEKDAEKALQAEKDFIKNLKKQSLIIRFPDPDLSKEIVQKFHPLIESVHFPHASTPRYCFAHLEETADIEKVVASLEQIPFGQGFLSVDIKKPREELCEVSPKDIDPYTLYVGNLPMNVTKQGVIQQFPGCTRIDIGHPQQLKNTRYAFVRFGNVEDAIKNYKNSRNTQFESRSLIVRFRRINGNVGVPGESKQGNTKTKSETQPEQLIEISSPPLNMKEKSEPITIKASNVKIPDEPNLDLVKEEPRSDHEDNCDVKPDFSAINGYDHVKKEIKTEPVEQNNIFRNEDDLDHPEEEEDFLNDTFQYTEENVQDEFEDEDDFEDEEDASTELNLNDTFLPCDDDDDF